MANKISKIEKADRFIKKHYPNTKFNIVSESVDFGVEGITIADAYTELKFANIDIPMRDLETYFRSNKTVKYDPFTEYFSKLNYDGITDHIQQLSSFIKTDNQPFFEAMFKKHLVRTVGQAIGDGIFVNRYVIVLKSTKEHLGKSTYIRNLEPFGGDYYTEDLGSKQALALSKNFIFNIEELETFNKADLNKLKALISSSTTTNRVLYTQMYAKRVRRCSIFASTNEEMFLGGGENSRWMIFNVLDIDFSYNDIKRKKRKIDINDVWAQAYHLYKSDFDYDLNDQEWLLAKQTNKKYVYKHDIDLHIEELLKYHEHAFATATQIGEYFKLRNGKPFAANFIGKAMIEAGYEKVSQGTKYGYRVVTNENKGIEGTNLEIKRMKNNSGQNDIFLPKNDKNEPF